MKVLGLTGGIGMGKSTSAILLRERGVMVVDTDDLARDLVQPGEPALVEVRQAFGADIVGPDGQLRREELARRVFANPEARKQLEAILHPRIRERWRAQVEDWRRKGHTVAVVVIPLLYETGAVNDFDAIICVACSPATQTQRLLERSWKKEEIAQRIAAQMPSDEKVRRANYVIWTEGDVSVHAVQLDRILQKL
jgi:dephospho-CoA kinase